MSSAGAAMASTNDTRATVFVHRGKSAMTSVAIGAAEVSPQPKEGLRTVG